MPIAVFLHFFICHTNTMDGITEGFILLGSSLGKVIFFTMSEQVINSTEYIYEHL